MTRIDAWDKLRGTHRYPTDYAERDMLWLRLVRSTVPHGVLRRIDLAEARTAPGVVDVLTAADIPGTNGFGLIVPDQPVLCGDRVRQVGDPVALVVATSDAAARAGADLVRVDIEPLPVVAEIGAALADGAVKIYPGGNVCDTVEFGHGDVDAAFAAADLVYSSTYRTPRQAHVFLEVEGGISYVENGVVTVVAGGQNPFADRAQIATALDLELGEVRVVNPPSGGAFGGKEDCSVQIPLALAALRTGRPCRFVYDRRESLIAGVKRHPFEVRYRTAATRSGRLLALDVDFDADAGAYTTLSPGVIALAAEHACGGYDLAAARVRGRAVFTNNGNASAFRGFGSPQVLAGLEQHLDLLGRDCGLDSVEVRRRNVAVAGTSTGLVTLDPASAHGVLEEAAGRRRTIEQPADHTRRRGTGSALAVQGFGLGAGVETGALVLAGLGEDGSLHLEVSAPDMGTGALSTFAMIAADALGVTAAEVTVRSGDSAGPDSGPSNASRSLYVIGNATAVAAGELVARIKAVAAKIADVAESAVDLAGGRIVAGEVTMTFAELAAGSGPLSAEGEFRPEHHGEMPIIGVPHLGYAAGFVDVTVEVDLLTGEIELVAADAIVDPGRVINPQAVRAQIEGGMAQGAGFALMEDAVYDGGRLTTDRLSSYLVPTIADLPVAATTVTLTSTPSPTNPLGVRGIAELGVSPMAPAIANAVADAIGVRFDRFPIRARDVLAALRREAARV